MLTFSIPHICEPFGLLAFRAEVDLAQNTFLGQTIETVSFQIPELLFTATLSFILLTAHL